MLIHEFSFLSHNALNWGWDEYQDTTSVPGYTFYGLAEYSAVGVPPLTSAGAWFIVALNTTSGHTRYYPPNQIWDNRGSLSLPS